MKSSKPSKLPTIKDVAAAAGVSLGTVSAVLHNRRTVHPDIRQRVKQAIGEIGYSPNAIAQSMRSGATKTIGILVRDINAPSIGSFVAAAQDTLYEAGYATLIGIAGDKQDQEVKLLNVLAGRKVDGLLVSHQPEDDPDILTFLKSARVPIVIVEREQPADFDMVLVNHRDAIRRATEYLLAMNHRRIALIVGLPDLYPSREKIIGFELAYQSLGIQIDQSLILTKSHTVEYGYEQTARLIQTRNRPTAIVTGGPLLSGALRAINESGLRIPQDISLIATSNTELAELTVPSISSERWDAKEIGVVSANLLLDRIVATEPYEPRRVMLKAEFFMRDSCAPANRYNAALDSTANFA